MNGQRVWGEASRPQRLGDRRSVRESRYKLPLSFGENEIHYDLFPLAKRHGLICDSVIKGSTLYRTAEKNNGRWKIWFWVIRQILLTARRMGECLGIAPGESKSVFTPEQVLKGAQNGENESNLTEDTCVLS